LRSENRPNWPAFAPTGRPPARPLFAPPALLQSWATESAAQKRHLVHPIMSSATSTDPEMNPARGGEEIYASDGLPTIPPPRAPTQRRPLHQLTRHEEDVLDDGGNVDATKAFEVFKGKIFVSSGADSSSRSGFSAVSRAAIQSESIKEGVSLFPKDVYSNYYFLISSGFLPRVTNNCLKINK